MNINSLIINQYKLFNNLEEKLIVEKLVLEKILVYNDIKEIDVDNLNKYSIENIEWHYDKNNYRIPYSIEKNKISLIKLDNNDNIYDFISSASIINDDNEIICGENFIKLADCFIGTINSLYTNPNTYLFSKLNIEIDSIDDKDERFINYKKIFIKTDDIKKFYNKFNNNLGDKIIITHNSDCGIDYSFSEYINK